MSDTWQTCATGRPLATDVKFVCLSPTVSKLLDLKEKLSDSIFSATLIRVRSPSHSFDGTRCRLRITGVSRCCDAPFSGSGGKMTP
jgi:hypothetical protein